MYDAKLLIYSTDLDFHGIMNFGPLNQKPITDIQAERVSVFESDLYLRQTQH
jgi:hypothetical protein